MTKSTTKENTSRVNTSVNSIESFLKMSLSSGNSAEQMAQEPAHVSYHEMESIPVREVATLEQLERNVQLLGDLRSRLQFMNREVRYLLKL